MNRSNTIQSGFRWGCLTGYFEERGLMKVYLYIYIFTMSTYLYNYIHYAVYFNNNSNNIYIYAVHALYIKV